ncbi:acetylserotonin O-methyltransferase [Streptomyces sp. NBC_01275]|uniref:methyltransferase n=1 Tax=Streptomyces sp. NBC_01275 TaxID=2903807 RepID=UPI002255FFB8|nr:methyltransferase [Streptomyces sp. NBC_01275]MCX4760224.1 acetylserotonin O-methyltransferase [Streptomyces sp. NBC_01275]
MDMDIMGLAAMGWVGKSLSAAAELRLADRLAERPMTVAELAKETDTQPDVLEALMRILPVLGLFQRDDADVYRNSPLSERLREDHPQSMLHYVRLSTGLYADTFTAITHTLRTGESAFRSLHGTRIYEYLEQNSEAADLYDKAMADLARPVAAALADTYAFERVGTVLDVGGNSGELLKGLLRAHPHLKGVSFDRSGVCERATADLAASDQAALAERLTFHPGSFLEEVPAGADLYLVKNVLHNWNHDNSVVILSRIREAVERTGADRAPSDRPRLLVIEPLVETDVDWIRVLFQMVVCEDGTRGRTDDVQRAQITEAGFEVRSTFRLATGHTVHECVVGAEGAS